MTVDNFPFPLQHKCEEGREICLLAGRLSHSTDNTADARDTLRMVHACLNLGDIKLMPTDSTESVKL